MSSAPNGQTLFPGTSIKQIGGVKIGFIGMTLKETATLVSPDGVAGLTFADEAATANAAVPALKAAGAQAIVLLIHQGGTINGAYYDRSCPGLSGDILPILAKLDPAIALVVSGHTHNAYICRVPMAGGGDAAADQRGQIWRDGDRYPAYASAAARWSATRPISWWCRARRSIRRG